MRQYDHLRARRHNRNAGYSLLEIGLAIGIIGMTLASILSVSSDVSQQIKDSAATDRLREVYTAGQRYIGNTTIASGLISSTGLNATTAIPVGRTSANSAVPAGSLQALGYLPAEFVDANGYGQHHLMVARHTQDSTGADALDFLVEQVGGQTIPDLDLGRISAKMGAPGGSIMTKAPPGIAAGTIQGTGGGWSQAATSWSAGGITPAAGHAVAVAYANQTTMLADFLYRNKITGIPEANTMHTDINVNTNNLNNVTSINNGTNTLTLGSTIEGPDYGQVEVHDGLNACADGIAGCELAVSSVGGFYTTPGDGQIHFGSNISNGGLSLDAGPGTNLYVAGGTTSEGIIRADNNISMKTGTRIAWPDANSGSTGSLGVDTDNFWHLYNTGLRVDNDVRIGGNVYAQVFYDSNDGSYYVDPNGTSNIDVLQAQGISIGSDSPGTFTPSTTFYKDGTATIGGILTADNQINLPAIASTGASCSPNGAIAGNSNGTGQQMTCFNGLWTNAATTATISTYTLPNFSPADVYVSIGVHYYCAVSDTYENPPNNPNPPVANAFRIEVLSLDSNNHPVWGYSRGTSGNYGGAAYCIDY